jgi:hypothetical protein
MYRKYRVTGRWESAFLGMALMFCVFASSAVAYAQDAAELAAKSPHRVYSGMRSGVIRTARGWNAKDFAASLMNPNSTDITLVWKLTSDDPKYTFRDGRVGTWTGRTQIAAMHGATLNFYSPAAEARYDPAVTNFPVRPLSNFTGSVEFSSTLPIYVFSGHQFESSERTADDPDMAWYEAWYAGTSNAVPVSWDQELGQFVLPYTNYWHNVREWPTGWHSTLSLKNNTDKTVTYAVQHSLDHGTRRDPAEQCAATDYRNQTIEVTLARGQELNTTLESLFGWPINQTSYLEGILLIRPDSAAAAGKGTSVVSSMVPNTFGIGMCGSDPVISVRLDSPLAKVSATVEVSATTSDTPFYRVQKVEFYVDSMLVATKLAGPYNFNWDTTSVPNGAHSLQIKASTSGGDSASDSQNVLVFNPSAH